MPGPELNPIDPTEFLEGFDFQSMRPRKPSAIPRWISVVGARPQFVKLSPLCRAIEEHNAHNPSSLIEHLIIHTGQHYDRAVAGVFFDQMEIPAPNFNLGIGSGSAGTQLARALARMESILAAIQPDWVIVYGDTNSTLAGALLASRLNIPLAHVEAGCRSGQGRQGRSWPGPSARQHTSPPRLPAGSQRAVAIRLGTSGLPAGQLISPVAQQLTDRRHDRAPRVCHRREQTVQRRGL